jgi:DNA-binding CsgD family transcriptional regulator/pimeloyl-ACP methyl ester carboxylesterase
MNPPSVQYARTTDDFSIAFATSGAGRPLIFLPLTFSHVQLFWNEETILLQWLRGLAERFRLIQYDGRGQGMSTRGLSRDHNETHEILDLEAVIQCLKLDRFILLARGPMGHAAIRYAAAHPDLVEALVLFSLPASGKAWPAAFAKTLAEEDWELFLQSFTAFDGRPSDPEAAVRRLKQTVNKEDWSALIRNWIASDVRCVLPNVRVPALVVHPRDVLQPRQEESFRLAAALPDARMVVTDGSTQLGDPKQGLEALDRFIAPLPSQNEGGVSPPMATNPNVEKLSARELEVLRLLCAGRTNREIADALTISLNTVRHHVTSILEKTGSTNRTEAAAFALRRYLI